MVYTCKMKFKDILSEYDIPTAPSGHHHARSGWIQIDCPYCGRDSQGWHMGYSIAGNFVNCWRCGSHRLVNTLMEITGLSYAEIKKLLDTLERPHFESSQKPLSKLVIPTGVKKLHAAHKHYLHKRGFKWREIERVWKIWGIRISIKLSWRIWIPIYYHGEIVSWTTRSISSNPRVTRYVSAAENEEAMPHKELLYGEDFARHAVIVVEGIFDAWRIGQGAVATFGSGYSIEQLERIIKYPTRAICFDNEIEAQRRARRLVNDLSVFPGNTYNVVLDKKDASDESKGNIERLRKEILE